MDIMKNDWASGNNHAYRRVLDLIKNGTITNLEDVGLACKTGIKTENNTTMKVQWTEWPSYEAMQKIWDNNPEATIEECSQNFKGVITQVLEDTVIVSDMDKFIETEVLIDQIQIN